MRSILRDIRFTILVYSLSILLIFTLIQIRQTEDIKSTILDNPSNVEINREVIKIGTEIIGDIEELGLENFPSFQAEITAYCNCASCTYPYNDGITASGKFPQSGKTIAMDHNIPMGTKVIIEGFDTIFEVQDRRASIVGDRVDIYKDTHEEALNFGKAARQIWLLGRES